VNGARGPAGTAAPTREELAALGRTLVEIVCRLGEDLVEAIERCERCNGAAACDACFSALQATLRSHRLVRVIEERLTAAARPSLASVRAPEA
jgi:hypothetical protein